MEKNRTGGGEKKEGMGKKEGRTPSPEKKEKKSVCGLDFVTKFSISYRLNNV